MDSIPGGSSDDEVCISRHTLIGYYKECTSMNQQDKINYLMSKVKYALRVDDLSNEIMCTLRKLVSDYRSKLHESYRNFTRCYNRNKDWFDTYISFPVASRETNKENQSGRPVKKFEECTERTKRRKTEDVRKLLGPEELAFAAQVEYRSRGEVLTSKIIKDVVLHGPGTVASCKDKTQTHKTLSPDKALAFVIEAQLTKFQYNSMRTTAKEENCNLYPNYETITEAKKRCYPTGIICTEICAEVSLQNLMDHTTQRLFLSLNEVLQSLTKSQREALCLISKWGCDGSGSHSQYKQKFEEEEISDAYMMITSIVPIRLISSESGSQAALVIWQNPRPSSPRYCRPLRLQMAHETTELSKREAQNVQVQLDCLTSTKVQVEEECFVNHRVIMTMVDGKMINALTDTTSAQRCYLCGATSKDYNRLKFCMEKKIVEDNLKYGISSLHAWIRFAEFILHLSYKLKIAKWQVRKASDKEIVAVEKQRIQKEFWQKLGLHVDKPRQGGGTSTDGNTARTLFQHEEVVSEITGVNLNIIKRLHTILTVMSSGYTINHDKFKTFCNRTAAEFVMNYPWYNMSTTLHKVFIHGPTIIDSSDIAIGLLSEDAQESRNKDIRKYRTQFSRKFSRKVTMEDTYQRLLVSSDPYITGLRKLVPKKPIPLSQSVLNLLDEPVIQINE